MTPFCRSLGLTAPVVQAPVGSASTPGLAAAVSNAGGLGMLALSWTPPASVRERIRATRALTDRPFGVNVIIADFEDPHSSEEDRAFVGEGIAASIEARVPLLVLFWGPPAPFVKDAHRHGVKVFVQVGSLPEARAAAAAGVDAVIAQGIEAGGHVRGTTSIWELLPAAVEAVGPVPVLASGGIGDGRGLARALELGAQGVSLGTRFVACEEAYIHPVYKQRVVDSSAEDTWYGELFDVGWPAPHRVLRNNKTFEEWDAAGRPPPGRRPGEGTPIGTQRRPWGSYRWPRYATGMVTPDFDGDPEYAPMWAGESCGLVNDIKPAAAIVRDLAAEAEAVLTRPPDAEAERRQMRR